MYGTSVPYFCFIILFISGSLGLTFLNPVGPVTYRCLECICDTVSECIDDEVCIVGDACGRYRITPDFWIDAGKPTVNNEDPESQDSFVNCATNKNCATRSVQQYMDKYKRDCNGDGSVDCKDFYALHLLGVSACNRTLHENFLKRFDECDQPLKTVPPMKHNTNLFLPNYDKTCSKCLCEAASSCNRTLQCENGYCGMYRISRIYWAEAGKLVLPGDDPDRRGAFEDCVLNEECAEQTIIHYLTKFGKDCNGDKVTSCYDYMMINFNGGYGCDKPLNTDKWGMGWLERFNKCMSQEEF